MEIKLKPNGWHRRLQLFVFGERVPLFHNFCPYFWLTNFCILVTFLFPIVPLVKFLVIICGAISVGFNKAADYFEDSVCKPMFERMAANMSHDEVVETWFFDSWNNLFTKGGAWQEEVANELDSWPASMRDKYYNANSKKRKEKIRKFEAWKAKTPNWEQVIADIREKRKADMIQYQKDLAAKRAERMAQEQKDALRKADAEKRRQAMFQAIIKYTKWIIYPILLAVAAFILYWLYRGVSTIVIYIVAHFYLDRFITVMQYAGVILLGAGILFGFVYLLTKIFSKVTCSVCITCPSWLRKSLVGIGNGILWVVRGIGDACVSIWTVIMVFKKNYCPGIEWQEEKK